MNKLENGEATEELIEKNEESKEIAYPKPLFFILFLTIGIINNLGYVLILTGSQQFSSQLKNESLIAMYPLALMAFSSLSRFINSKFCIKISYFKRLLGLSIYFFSGYISLFIILQIVESKKDFNNTLAFFLTLIPSIIMGTGSSFGEATNLGYIRTFPKDYISGWSSGTGFAGVFGALISLCCKKYEWKLKNLYLFVSPVALIYFVCFYISFKVKEKYDLLNSNKAQKLYPKDTNEIFNEENNSNYDNQIENVKIDNEGDVSNNKEMNCKNFIEGFFHGKRFIINLALVYYLEYTINSGLCERVNKKGYVKSSDFFNTIQYETFMLCYQIGVVLSRSSLAIVKHISFIETFSIIQFINFVLWFIEVYSGFITNEWICFIHLIIVGLCGGASYVGCFYFVLNSQTIEPRIKELCLNIGTIFNDIGMLTSSISVLILDNTIMKI